MPHIPGTSRIRGTHSRSSRRSHSHSGFLAPMAYSDPVFEQQAIDGVLMPGDIPPGTVDGGAIVPASLDLTRLASSIRPPVVLDAAPTLPSDDYPEGTYYVDSATKILYKNVADVWTAVDPTDALVAGEITAGVIAAGAIGADQIAANAVTAGKLETTLTLSSTVQTATSGPRVVLDSSGVAIYEGALSFEDDYGSTVMTGAGFGPSWFDFIRNGIYDSMFSSFAAVDPLPDGSASTPFWTVSRTGSPTAKIVSATDYPGGKYVEVTFSAASQDLYLTSDLVPCPADATMTVGVIGTGNGATPGFVDLEYQTYEADGTTVIRSWVAMPKQLWFYGGFVTPNWKYSSGGWTDANARYIKFRVKVSSGAAYSNPEVVRIGGVRVDYTPEEIAFNGTFSPTPIMVGTQLGEPVFDVSASGYLEWGSGSSAVDANLYRVHANRLQTDDDFRALGALITKTTAGAPDDTDYLGTNAPNGGLIVDTTNHRLYARSTGWKYAAITSDERLKKVLGPVEGALERVKRLRPVRFRWKVPDEHGFGIRENDSERVGFVAQELLETEPLWVDENGVGGQEAELVGGDRAYCIDAQGQDIALLVAAVKELAAEVDRLKKKLGEE